MYAVQGGDIQSDALETREKTWILLGLGNPGPEYRNTYHNVGFRVLEVLAHRWRVPRWVRPQWLQARIAEVSVPPARVPAVLVQPWTYMNRAGRVLGPLFEHYRETARLLVISDDLALPVGKIRIRERGSAGGHNGLKSISSALGSDGYLRVRVGIGSGQEVDDTREYVLSAVSRKDRELLSRAERLAGEAVECVLLQGARPAMSAFNGTDLRDARE